MHPLTANGNFPPPFLAARARVRRAALHDRDRDRPPLVGDWAGACAAARVDVDLDLRAVARAHGSEFAAQVRADLRHLAPDLLRWHLPRIAPDGLLRPGLTVVPGPVRHAGATAVRAPRGPDPAGLGGLPVSGSASRCGTPSRRDAASCIRIPVPTAGSASTCTATCGTRAGPVSCGSGTDRSRRRTRRRRGAGGLRRGPVGGRGGDPAARGQVRRTTSSPCGSPAGTGCCWSRGTGAGSTGSAGGRARALPVLPDAATWVRPTWSCSAPD